MTGVVVCGSTFGRYYVEGLRRPSSSFNCVALLGRGSSTSRATARHFGVPLITNLNDLPAGTTHACVVVRSGLLGGEGTELAVQLMERGINVLQEHPVHYRELIDLIRASRANGASYLLNSFYRQLEPVRRFLAAAQQLRHLRPIIGLELASGLPTAYSLLDIVSGILGTVRPWRFDVHVDVSGADRLIAGTFAGVPFSWRLNYHLDPAMPDESGRLMHHISCITESGTLRLVDTQGPVEWHDAPYFDELRTAIGPVENPSRYLTRPPITVVAPASPSRLHTANEIWPEGAITAIELLHRLQFDPGRQRAHLQNHLALNQLWSELTAELGTPSLLRDPRPPPLTEDDIAAFQGRSQ